MTFGIIPNLLEAKEGMWRRGLRARLIKWRLRRCWEGRAMAWRCRAGSWRGDSIAVVAGSGSGPLEAFLSTLKSIW
jgi:hypothetical protein